MRMMLLLCALALFAGRSPAAALAADVPQFRDYLAAATHRGPNAPVVLASPTERMFRTRLRDGARQPPNFASDFVLTAWGCGAECLMGAAINTYTGEVAWLPGSICCWGPSTAACTRSNSAPTAA